MRAIIKCKSRIETSKLDGVLKEKGWWPTLAQEHPELLRRKDEILSHVAEDDLVMVKETMLFAIHDDITKSWGIVSPHSAPELRGKRE